MLTVEENERLTRVGRGTPMGELLRRYWQPIGGGGGDAASAGPSACACSAKTRALQGSQRRLRPDRRVLSAPPRVAAYGIPQRDGIRCPYHGWKFDGTGTCLEQPNEPREHVQRQGDDRRLSGRRTRRVAVGVSRAAAGAAVPPLDGLVAPHAIRMLGSAVVPCNWLQIMENSVDAVHTEWLHGHLFEFVLEHKNFKTNFTRKHIKTAFDEFQYGIIKRRVLEGTPKTATTGRSAIRWSFRTRCSSATPARAACHMRYQIRVPIDDTHTLHYWYHVFVAAGRRSRFPRISLDQRAPPTTSRIVDERGEYLLDSIHAQDIMAWITQGPIADRTLERSARPTAA